MGSNDYKIRTIEEAKFIRALLELNMLPGEALSEIACDLLSLGFEARPIRILAGESPTTIIEHANQLSKIFDELNVPNLTKAEALTLLGCYYAQKIVNKHITPYDGAVRIWKEVSYDHPENQKYNKFVGLASEYEDFSDLIHKSYYGDVHCEKIKSDIEKKIITEAKKLLRIDEK